MIAKLALATALSFLVPLGSAMAAEEKAIFAGGCFWCVESDFDKVPGVLATVSGYIGGTNDNPTYQNHTAYRHREAVEITFDNAQVSYDELLHVFWRSVDPTDGGGQFCDRGFSYTTAIYTIGVGQADAAKASMDEAVAQLGRPVATEIVEAPTFWPAEEYHQDYYRKNPLRYSYYRDACGRDDRVREVWGDAAFKAAKTN